MHRTVTEFFRTYFPFVRSPRVIVGLSGGADSVSLLVALKNSAIPGLQCIAAHCNFHLRGDESDRDERFCRDLCDRLAVTLLVKHFDVPAKCNDSGESVEMACRSLRYDWWNTLLDDGTADLLAVGHHREDNVETMMLNMMRGSGIAGIKGMLPVSGRIVRPLLETSRAAIEHHLDNQGFSWVTDRTNLENEYHRNRLRNIVLPTLEAEFPDALEGITRTLSNLRDNYAVYNDYVSGVRDRYCDDDGSIRVMDLCSDERNAATLLHELLYPIGFTTSQISDISSICSPEYTGERSGQCFTTHTGVKYVLDRGVMIPAGNVGDDYVSDDIYSLPLDIARSTREEFVKMKRDGLITPDTLFVDSRILEGDNEWTLRRWIPGDRLSPYGMRGSKLVSDIFNNAKAPYSARRSPILLFRNNRLLWVAGYRCSRYFAVTPDTNGILMIRLHETTH